jgi:hypothetical protein
MKFNEIVSAMRQRVAQSPDAVYQPVGGKGGSCFYREGNVTDGTVGCIVGQVLGDLIDDGVQIVRVVGKLANDYDAPVDHERVTYISKWLRNIQEWQDDGQTWSKALTNADNAYPQVAEYAW